MENYNNRYSILITKPPEKEGQGITGCVQQLIMHLFGKDLLNPLANETAYHTPKQKDPKTITPQLILVKFLNFQDKFKKLRLAWQKGALMIKEMTKIHFYYIYSAEVSKQ